MDLLGTLLKPNTNMCEVIFRDSFGAWPNMDLVDQEQEFGGLAIGYFTTACIEKRGTGFIIKICERGSQFHALILTAAHVFMKNWEYSPSTQFFRIDKELFLALPLKRSLDWSNSSLFPTDPVSGMDVSVPEDWVICGLSFIPGLVYSKTLIALPLIDLSASVQINTDVMAYGFPLTPNPESLTYFAPGAKKSDFNSIINALCGGSKLVCSKGRIIAVGNIISASCITANGMSGAPLIIRYSNGFRVIGFLFGGPSCKLQKLSSKLIISKNFSDLSTINEILHELEVRPCNSPLEALKFYLREIVTCTFDVSKTDTVVDLLKYLYSRSLKLESKAGTFISYNNFQFILAIHQEIAAILNLYH